MQPKLFNEPFNFPGHNTADGVEILLKITPRASKNRIGKIVDDGQGKLRLCVYITAAPEDNKANLALIDFLANLFNISKSSCKIVLGEHSRQKTLFISNQNTHYIEKFLA